MIHVTQVTEFTFTIQFDERMRETLLEVSGWGSVEYLIRRVLSDAFIGLGLQDDYYGDLDDDVPF